MLAEFHPTALVILAIYSVALGAVATTIAAGRVFKEFRFAVHRRSLWLGALVSCPYCTSHWLSAIGLLLLSIRPVTVVGGGPVGALIAWGMAWFASIALAAMVCRLIGHVNATDQERIIENHENVIAELRRENTRLLLAGGWDSSRVEHRKESA